jgi:hypothetical protein
MGGEGITKHANLCMFVRSHRLSFIHPSNVLISRNIRKVWRMYYHAIGECGKKSSQRSVPLSRTGQEYYDIGHQIMHSYGEGRFIVDLNETYFAERKVDDQPRGKFAPGFLPFPSPNTCDSSLFSCSYQSPDYSPNYSPNYSSDY